PAAVAPPVTLAGCDCGGDASSGTPAASQNAAGAAAVGPALYAGLNSPPSGSAIRFLFVMEAGGDYGASSPLQAEILSGGRFLAVPATDETRMLGETGMLTLASDLKPTKAELFGQSLNWVRLSPTSGAAAWAPRLSGAYLNAVWAEAAETMT